jgi:predicted Fe-Mo cluster-binding NifX family protein
MIVLISSAGSDLESSTEPRFGRSPWYVKYDTDSEHWEAFENPGKALSGGAGIAAAQFAVDQKASKVVSGDFGPNAVDVLRAAKIEMVKYPQEAKTINDVLKFIKESKS